jgi:hypothetical protein
MTKAVLVRTDRGRQNRAKGKETGKKKGPRNVSVPEALSNVAIERESLPACNVKHWVRSRYGFVLPRPR